MTEPRVIIVILRRPKPSDPDEMRSDPFWEFGSFGCTRCHTKNLLSPKKAPELEGAMLAFAQGGDLGFRLVYLSPPIEVVRHKRLCEARWTPWEMPFRYPDAPLLINNRGTSHFKHMRQALAGTRRSTWEGKFSSRFRARRRPLYANLARELVRTYKRRRSSAPRGSISKAHVEALPSLPPKIDSDRKRTYRALLAKAGKRALRKESC